MVISHHIATELAAERQRDLRSSSRPGWRFSFPFGRRAAELEPVPPVEVASATGGDGPGPAPAPRPELRVRRGPARRGHDAAPAAKRARERTGV